MGHHLARDQSLELPGALLQLNELEGGCGYVYSVNFNSTKGQEGLAWWLSIGGELSVLKRTCIASLSHVYCRMHSHSSAAIVLLPSATMRSCLLDMCLLSFRDPNAAEQF